VDVNDGWWSKPLNGGWWSKPLNGGWWSLLVEEVVVASFLYKKHMANQQYGRRSEVENLGIS
jgi:hypothetical protein